MRHAVTRVGEREMPAEQCTSIFLLSLLLSDLIAPSTILHASSLTYEMSDVGELLSDKR